VGNARRASARFEDALQRTREAYGPDHRYVAVCLAGMADAYALRGDLEEALDLDREAVEVFATALGPEHTDVVRRRQKMGIVLRRLGRYAEAASIQEAGLAAFLASYGPKSAYVLRTRHELGRLHLEEGQWDAALDQLRQARRICQAAFPPMHPLRAEVLADLAAAFAAAGQADSSLAVALEAEAIARQHLAAVSLSLAQTEVLHFSSQRPSARNVLLDLARAGVQPEFCWQALSRSRALVLDTVGRRQRILHLSADPAVQEQAAAFARASRRYAHLLLSRSEDPARHTEILERARLEMEAAERAWVSAGGEGLRDPEVPIADLQELRRALPPRGALVSCFRGGAEDRYVVFILREEADDVAVVDLGPGPRVDASVESWLDQARRGLLDGSEADYRAAGKDLAAKVWTPLVSRLEKSGRVFVVPDGQLHRISLDTLPTDDDGYLIEGPWAFHYLTREADLLPPADPSPPTGVLVAVGGPDYDHSPSFDEDSAALRGAGIPCPDVADLHFAPLPETGAEVDTVAALWCGRDAAHRAVRLTGSDADEAAVKRLMVDAEVLHLATHGFVLGDACLRVEGTRGLGGLGFADEAEATPPASPLQLAGLALAGANRRDRSRGGEEDGILTAEEIAALDLTRLRWAVLSACDTGGGAIHNGEGVLGLRRAFQVAGVRTLIMSLWPVRDRVAREWMIELYRARIGSDATAVDAVRAAGLRLLQENRRRGHGGHPALWGAFVACGDWR
jgi:CHAT domain-containing protein